MNNRRRLMLALGGSALAASFPSVAQTPKVYRVGMLAPGSTLSDMHQFFLNELRMLGYVEGKNLSIVVRFAESRLERLPTLAAELVAERVDVIFAPSSVTAKAAHQATSSIPIVFAVVFDPVALGFAQSLARPGYNMTGTSSLNSELSAKRVEILKEFFPKTSRLAVLVTDEPQVPPQLEQIQMGAKHLGISILTAQVMRREDLKGVGKQLRAWRANAIFVPDSSINTLNARLLAELAAQLHVPAMFGHSLYPDAGGLMSYGPNNKVLWRLATSYVDKILKGANPSDLPIGLPTHYELVINMKTAKALGIKVPQSLLLRADRVIE